MNYTLFLIRLRRLVKILFLKKEIQYLLKSKIPADGSQQGFLQWKNVVKKEKG